MVYSRSEITSLPRAVARQVSHHVEALNIFEPRRVPVILRGEYGEINKFEKMKRQFVEIATALIFFVSFSIKGKSDPSGAFKKVTEWNERVQRSVGKK